MQLKMKLVFLYDLQIQPLLNRLRDQEVCNLRKSFFMISFMVGWILSDPAHNSIRYIFSDTILLIIFENTGQRTDYRIEAEMV